MKVILPPVEVIKKWAAKVSDELDADIVFYAGDIAEPHDFSFIGKIKRHRKRQNLLIILTTAGGSADAAYRMMRHAQDKYDEGKITLFIPNYCKSAGTLMAVGADVIVMTDVAELGPLDVQLRKPDELGEWTSGLTPLQALTALRTEAFTCFEQHFLLLREKSGKQITAKTAAEIAVKLTTGWFQPIYEQLDPMRLSETQRAMTIGLEYGQRLSRGNINSEGLNRLIAEYPSHGFIIDRREVAELFNEVRPPTEAESNLTTALLRAGVVERGVHPAAERPEIWFISQEECPLSAELEWKGDEHEQEDPITTDPAASKTDSRNSQTNEQGGTKPARNGKKPIRSSPGNEKPPLRSHRRVR